MKHALLLVRHELTRRNIEVVTDLEPDLPKVLIDSGKMEQVVVNLLTNALHAMDGKESGRLEVRTHSKTLTSSDTAHDEGARSAHQFRPGNEVVELEILDTGTGIADEKVGKIFDPFFTTKATGVGTGLGLTVVKKIVELHKGSLKIQNRQAEGVRATITLKAYDESESGIEDGGTL